MGKIAVHEFITLDGVFEDPTFTFEFAPWDPKMEADLAAITGSSEAILLGRNTFEMFAPAWSTRTAEEDPGAPFFNDSKKYVVASREPAVEWNNSEVIGTYDPERIQQLKDETAGNIYVGGSGQLVRAMLKDGLVDDLHLFMYPVAHGSGGRLFGNDPVATKLAVKDSATYTNGVVHLALGPAA